MDPGVLGGNLKLDMLTNQGNLEAAIGFGLETLALLGEPMPDPSDKAALGASIGAAFGAFQASIGGREVASLRDLPSMTDPEKLARLATMAATIPSAFQINPELNVLLVLRAAGLSLSHGTGPTSPFFYALYGIVHHVVTSDYARAFQFGQLGLELAQRPEHAAVRCRAHFIFATRDCAFHTRAAQRNVRSRDGTRRRATRNSRARRKHRGGERTGARLSIQTARARGGARRASANAQAQHKAKSPPPPPQQQPVGG